MSDGEIVIRLQEREAQMLLARLEDALLGMQMKETASFTAVQEFMELYKKVAAQIREKPQMHTDTHR